MIKKVVVVTGAAGMIGKVVVEKLLENGYFVRVLIRDKQQNCWQGKKQVEVVSGDVCDKTVLSKLLGNAYGLIHLAVEMDVSLPWEVFYRVNVLSIKFILEKVPADCKTVMVSSVGVYADTGYEKRGEGWRLKKEGGKDKYIRSKIMALKLVRKSKNKVISVMPSVVVDKNTFGKQKLTTNNPLLLWLWNNIGGGVSGGLMSAVGDPKRIVNFIEVSDVANGIVLAMEKGKNGQEYILSGINMAVGEYLKIMAKIVGKQHLKIRIPMFCLKFFNLEPLVNMCFTYNKAKLDLGYNPVWKI